MQRHGAGGVLGVDAGGTFTDFVLLDEKTGRIAIGKVLTTPSDPSDGTKLPSDIEDRYSNRYGTTPL